MMSELYSVSQMSLTDVSPGASVHFEKKIRLFGHFSDSQMPKVVFIGIQGLDLHLIRKGVMYIS